MFSISSSNCCCVRFWVPCAMHQRAVLVIAIAIGSVCPYLESKVLQEVGSAVGLVRLGAASSIDPYTDRRRLGPWGVLGSDLRRRVNCSPAAWCHGGHTVKPLPRVVDSVFAP
jgi:hypothetical protein